MATDKTKEDLEKEKLSKEIELQQFEIDKEKKRKGNSKVSEDDSDKADLKAWATWGQVVATFVLGAAGFYFSISNNTQQEQNRNMQMATQLMANREGSETEFRRNMFKPMIDEILNDTGDLKKRIAIFKVFQNNFHDLFNSRALYDVLDDAVRNNKKSDSSNNKEYLKNLKSLARQTNEEEGLLINGGTLILDSLLERSSTDTIVPEIKDEDDRHDEKHWWQCRDEDDLQDEKHWWQWCNKDSCLHRIRIEVISINTDRDYVKIKLTLYPDYPDTTTKIAPNNGESFSVQYYDSPLTDNILLPDRHRVSVILEDIYPHEGSADTVKRAKLKIIHFPGSFITTGYRPSIDKVNDLIRTKE